MNNLFESFLLCLPFVEMPAITLLPAKLVNDLRVIADYLVKAPGENQTGIIIESIVTGTCMYRSLSADIMSLYAQIRCSQLGRAMNSLLQHSQGQNLLPSNVS